MTYKEALDKRAAQLPVVPNGRVPSADLLQRGGKTYGQLASSKPIANSAKPALSKSTTNTAAAFNPNWARHLHALKYVETRGEKDPLHAVNKNNPAVLGQFQQTKAYFKDGTGMDAVDTNGNDLRTSNQASRAAVIGYARKYPGWSSYDDLARLHHYGLGWKKHVGDTADKAYLAAYNEGLADYDRLHPTGATK